MRLKKFYTPGKIVFKNYNALLGSSTSHYFTIEDDSNEIFLVYQCDYYTISTDEKKRTTNQVPVSQDVTNLLNDALCRIATNAYRAHVAVARFTSIDSFEITLEGSAELGTKYKKIMATGGGFGGSIKIPVKTATGVRNQALEKNDIIQSKLVTELDKMRIVMAWSDGREISLNTLMPGTKIAASAKFGKDVRVTANELAREHYNKVFFDKTAVRESF